MTTTINNLQHGQYFQCNNIVARFLTPAGHDPIVVLFNEKPLHSGKYSAPPNWFGHIEPIDYQTTIALLTKECIDNNQYTTIDPQPTKATVVPRGQFFICGTKIGRIADDNNIYYLNPENYLAWDYCEKNIVVPITFPQAILQLAKELCK
jgi:hypothetical protein